MDQICKSENLTKLLGYNAEEYDDDISPEDIIPYKYSFPHEYIPGTQKVTDRFVNYEISANIDSKNNTFKDLTIYFFVLCHEDIIQYDAKGIIYLWYDLVACELDNIFCEKNVLGIGKTTLVSNTPYCPQQKYKGRLLKFVVKDFNNGLKNGK